MIANETKQERMLRSVELPDGPDVPGLVFRHFRGPADYAGMADVIRGSSETDGLERTASVEEMERSYRHLINSDPDNDMLIVDVEGQMAGYSRVWWQQELEGRRLYIHFFFFRPEWRGLGIRRAVLRHNERRLRQIASGHPDDGPRVLVAWASYGEEAWGALLVEEGYDPVRYGLSMVRPNLEDIPDLPLPEGLVVRPVQSDQVQAVWDGVREAFRDHWSYSEEDWSDEHLKEWQEGPTFEPDLWQVAWDGDQVAGMVLNVINAEENAEYGRQRGYTEIIAVRRPWRRQGLARVLIARSLRLLKERGMAEAALGVDAENTTGALQLYRHMGFEEVKRHTTYWKDMAVGS